MWAWLIPALLSAGTSLYNANQARQQQADQSQKQFQRQEDQFEQQRQDQEDAFNRSARSYYRNIQPKMRRYGDFGR